MPGGVIEPPSAHAKAGLRALLPNVEYGLIEGIATTYRIESTWIAETPASIRKTMQEISEQAAALYVRFGTLSEESRNQLFDALQPVGDVDAFFQTVEHASQLLMGAARNAALAVDTKSGQPIKAARRKLVRRIARLLIEFGYTADASSSGPLCRAVGLILEGYGETVADIRSVVRPALVTTV